MKVIKDKTFNPITIQIESEKEAIAIYALLNANADSFLKFVNDNNDDLSNLTTKSFSFHDWKHFVNEAKKRGINV